MTDTPEAAKALAIVRALANVRPEDWLSKREIHTAISEFRTVCCYIGVVPTFRCPGCPHDAVAITAGDRADD